MECESNHSARLKLRRTEVVQISFGRNLRATLAVRLIEGVSEVSGEKCGKITVRERSVLFRALQQLNQARRR